jgi:hypothetical protein
MALGNETGLEDCSVALLLYPMSTMHVVSFGNETYIKIELSINLL